MKRIDTFVMALALAIVTGTAAPPPALAQGRAAQASPHVRVFEGPG